MARGVPGSEGSPLSPTQNRWLEHSFTMTLKVFKQRRAAASDSDRCLLGLVNFALLVHQLQAGCVWWGR